MKEPLLFRKLLNYWTTVPKMLDAGIADGHASREPMSGFVPFRDFPQFLTCCRPKLTHTLPGLMFTIGR
jgi:hypothetical protein